MGATLEVTVLGQEDLRRAARLIRHAARSDLQREMLAGLRNAVRPIGTEVRKDLPVYLPDTYALVLGKALRFTTATKTTGWPEITVTARAKGQSEPRRITAINAGVLRAPLFGNRSFWFAHKVRRGFFDEPAERVLGDVKREGAKSVQRVVDKLEREI